MYLTFAWRYFKAKKSANAINWISWVTVGVIAFATACQILVLSVFNGFEGLVKSLYSSFYTDIKIIPQKGKTFILTNDQIEQIKKNPDSRRLIVSAWNVGEIDKMKLPPCHAFFQFYVADGKLSCQLYQRSADIFLGVPFNIASYALLTMMVAQVCDLKYGDFIHTLGDAHLYSNHIEQANLQLSRDFRSLPTMKMNPAVKNIFDFKFEDFTLEGYDPHPHIKAAVAV